MSKKKKKKKQTTDPSNGVLSSGSINIDGTEYEITSSSGISIGSSQLSAANTSFSWNPRSQQEEKELEDLKKDREFRTVELKRQKFKALPSDMRQSLINNVKMLKISNDFSNLEAPKITRQEELENKHNSNFIYNGLSSGVAWTSITSNAYNCGLSLEEMEQLHNDACADEILLNLNRSE